MINIIALIILIVPILFKVFREKKWYLYLMFSLYPILPDAFAIEISSSLPLLTVSRIILLLNMVIWLTVERGRVKLNFRKNILIFWGINILVSLINLVDYTGEINKIFNIILHQILVVLILKALIKTKEEFIKCLDYMLLGFVVSCFAGVLQTLFSVDASEPLMLVFRGEQIGLNERMGMERARGFSISPIMFACECGFHTLLALYLYEHKEKKKYIFFILIYIAGIILSMSRSSMLGLGLVLLLFLITRYRVVLKKYIKYIGIALAGAIIILIIMPDLANKLLNPIKSALNVLGMDFSIASDFGDNVSNPVGSRSFQWSLLLYMIEQGTWLIGYGYNAYARGLLYFHYEYVGYSGWDKAQALDVGFVTVLGEGGVIGLLNYWAFLVGILVTSFVNRKKGKESKFNFYKLSVYLIIYYIIMNIATYCIDIKSFWLFIGLWIVYDEAIRKHSWKESEENEIVNCNNVLQS